MAKFASLSVMFIAAMVIAIVASHAEAVVTCGTVATDLSPCLDYVRMGGAIPTMCCNGNIVELITVAFKSLSC